MNRININKLPKVTAVNDMFDRYIFHVFIPELMKRYPVVTQDISGDVLWDVTGTIHRKKYTQFFATPSSEGTINFQFENENGIVEILEEKYELNNWSMDVETDVYNFVQFVGLVSGQNFKCLDKLK
jgi:hypothetical protein